MAKAIMIQGTMSNAGKSIIAAALLRIFKQDGYSCAPFKSQNMALNSFVTEDGLEMGRAQVMQAYAAGIKPEVIMNPILLKPTSDRGSQVIVNGVVRGEMDAAEYFKYKKTLIPDIQKAYNELSKKYDIIVIEGAGSPAEINLKENDIVNMGMAKLAAAPVLLVGDIDRGGVFAQLYGTVALLDDDERKLIKGFIINKFRGDKKILESGLSMIENLTGKRVAGVVPYGHFRLDDEDSLSERLNNKKSAVIDIAVLHLPHISNFTDFTVFDFIEGVSVRYVKNVAELANPDAIIIPGSKNTASDMIWLRENGLEAAVKKYKGVVFGICGGYQMLGMTIFDDENAESGENVRGMELLPVTTSYCTRKTLTRVCGRFAKLGGILEPLTGAEFEGYEIHHGKSIADSEPVTAYEGGADGAQRGNIYGTYIHGVFDKCAYEVVKCLCRHKGIDCRLLNGMTGADVYEREYDALADLVREGLDMDYVYEVLHKGAL